jgi:hypothetical protein
MKVSLLPIVRDLAPVGRPGQDRLTGAARFDAADRHSAGRSATHRNGDQPCTTPSEGSGVVSHLLNGRTQLRIPQAQPK